MRATIVFVILAIFIAVFFPLFLQYLRAPAGTIYALGDGYVPDYYQYLSWIKSGQLGHLLLNSRYSSIAQPVALIHPLYSITGLVTGVFHVSPPIAYVLLRAASLLIFFFALYRLIQMFFLSIHHRIIGLLFFLTGTGFETIPWSGHFGIISKYSLPPHHLLALSAWMGLIVAFAKRTIVLTIILGWSLALLHPSIFLFAMIFLAITHIRKTQFWILLLGVTPIIVYNVLTLRSIPPWSIMYIRMLAFNPPTTSLHYLLSLGPLLPLSILGAWNMRNGVLTAWAYLPIVLFPFVGIIPMNYSRLFQTYQYIPITLLAVSGIFTLKKPVRLLLTALLIIYGSIAYVATLQPQLKRHDLPFYNVFVPKPLLAAFGFLDRLPQEQVVMSGEYVSGMIPAFTKHRAVIGRDDIIAHYYPLRDKVFAFLDGRMTEVEALTFAQDQKINYVIFGVDTKPLSDLPTKNYHFLVPVFTDGTVSVTLRK